MFSIIVSEKGGAERREAFDKTEINVGRVQGNDLMLPKGNVSKRHARLLYRDGRFIVTDLKSTNGTYVNGRKIAQATIVREGDKIYIGDFVLRIELSAEAAQAAAAPEPADDHADDSSANVARGPSPSLAGAPTAGPPPLPGAPAPAAPPAPRPPDVGRPSGPSAPPPLASPRETALGPGPRLGASPSGAPPFPIPPPLGSIGDAPPVPVAPAPVAAPPPPVPVAPAPVAAPPPVPVAPAPVTPAPVPVPPLVVAPVAPPPMAPPAPVSATPAPQPTPMAAPPSMVAPPAYAPAVAPVSAPPVAPISGGPSSQNVTPVPGADPALAPAQVVAPPPPTSVAAPTAPPPKLSAPPSPPSIPASSQPSQSPRSSVRDAAASEGVVDSSQAAAHREALLKLMDRATAAIDTAPLASGEAPSPALGAAIERALAEKAGQMRAAGEIPAGLDSEVLVAEARRELFDLGPIGPLLEDEYVEEVQVIRHDHVVALHGKKQVATEIAFTSEAAVSRLLRRICVRSGRPLGAGELFIERRLDRGARLFGVIPPASGDGHLLVIRKPQRALSTLEDLVRAGTVARQMATLFAHAVQGRSNILVTGGVGSGAIMLLGALAGAGNLEDRVVVLQEDDELVLNQPHAISMLIGDTAEEGARAVHAAIRVRPDRLIVGAFAGHVVAEIVDAVGDGVDGVLASARAPTLRHLVARLPADVAATRRLMGVDTAREWLAGSFDLVVEVARLRDGRHRVMRVAEFSLAQGNPLELRDIFTFTVERTAAGGMVEGSFVPTGVVPRVAEDLVARGIPLDLSIFKRATR